VDITGRLQTKSWDKDGEKRYATEINVQNVILLDSKPRGDSQGGESYGGGFETHGPDVGSDAPADDGIPF
jgi:single-strand DNA-binding protein